MSARTPNNSSNPNWVRRMAPYAAAFTLAAAVGANESQAKADSASGGTKIENLNGDPRFVAKMDLLHKMETGQLPNRVLGAIITFSVKPEPSKNGLYWAPLDGIYTYSTYPNAKVNYYMGWAPRCVNYKDKTGHSEKWLPLYDIGRKQNDLRAYSASEVSQGSATDWAYTSFLRLNSLPADLKFWYTPGSALDGKAHNAGIDQHGRLTLAGMPEGVPGTMKYFSTKSTLNSVSHMKRMPNSVATSLC